MVKCHKPKSPTQLCKAIKIKLKMGNKKNRKNGRSNTSRHVNVKKKLRHTDRDTTDRRANRNRSDTNEGERISIEGSRIMNLERLQQYTENLEQHC